MRGIKVYFVFTRKIPKMTDFFSKATKNEY